MFHSNIKKKNTSFLGENEGNWRYEVKQFRLRKMASYLIWTSRFKHLQCTKIEVEKALSVGGDMVNGVNMTEIHNIHIENVVRCKILYK